MAAGLPFVGMENVSGEDGTIRLGAGARSGAGAGASFLFDERHVLFGKLRPYLRKTAAADAAGCCSMELVPLLARPTLDRRFLLHWLRTPAVVQAVSAKQTGARMPRADMDVLFRLSLQLPSLDEQRIIVERLDAAVAIRQRAKSSRLKANVLTQAVFVDMFGDTDGPYEPLGALAHVSSGLTKGRKLGSAATRPAPYMRVANIQDGSLDLSEVKLIDSVETDFPRFSLVPGDLLMTEGGDADKLGRCAVWTGEVEKCLHQNHVFRVRVDRDRLLPEYAAAFMQSDQAKRYFLRVAKRTTGIASINKTQLGSLPVAVPPLSVQQLFVSHVAKIGTLASTLTEAAAKADSIATALWEEFV